MNNSENSCKEFKISHQIARFYHGKFDRKFAYKPKL